MHSPDSRYLRAMKVPFAVAVLTLTLPLSLSACDSSADDHGDDHADHTHGDHSETHADHGDDTSDADAAVDWHTEPPATATVSEAFDVMFMITTTGEIHTREIRICEGVDVADCGLGDMDSFISIAATHDEDSGMDSASVTLDAAGDYTVVAYTHIGADPHVSNAVNVTAS